VIYCVEDDIHIIAIKTKEYVCRRYIWRKVWSEAVYRRRTINTM